MTNDQTQNLLKIIMANYRNQFNSHSQQDITILKNTWQLLLGNLDYDVVYNAVMQHIADGEQYPPIAGTILSKLTKRSVGKDEAYNSFEHVIYLIGKYGSWNYKAAHNEMSQIEQQIMTPSYYNQLCNSESLDVPRSQYRDYYMAVGEKQLTTNKELTGEENKKLTWDKL